MSTETREDAEGVEDPVGDERSGHAETGSSHDETPPTADSADQRNDVSVHFENGDVADYAFVVRSAGADWLYAERLAAGEDGFDDEDVEAVNAEKVCRITASRVHLFDEGVVHFGDDLVVDPATLLEDSWFDAGTSTR